MKTAENLLLTASLESDIDVILENLGTALEVSRAYILKKSTSDEDNCLVRQIYEWTTVDDEQGIDSIHLQNLLYGNEFERWRHLLSRGEIICGDIEDFPDNERTFFGLQRIQSILIVPIFVGSDWWGLIGFDECERIRQWNETDIDAVKTVSRILGEVMYRQTIEEDFHQFETRYRMLFEKAGFGISIFERYPNSIDRRLDRLQ